MRQLFESIFHISEVISNFAGISLGMMLAIFIISSIAVRVCRIREWKNHYEHTMIGGIVLVVSCLMVGLTQDFKTWQALFRHGLMAGGVSSFAYQIFKPVFSHASKYVVKKIKARMEMPDSDNSNG